MLPGSFSALSKNVASSDGDIITISYIRHGRPLLLIGNDSSTCMQITRMFVGLNITSLYKRLEHLTATQSLGLCVDKSKTT